MSPMSASAVTRTLALLQFTDLSNELRQELNLTEDSRLLKHSLSLLSAYCESAASLRLPVCHPSLNVTVTASVVAC